MCCVSVLMCVSFCLFDLVCLFACLLACLVVRFCFFVYLSVCHCLFVIVCLFVCFYCVCVRLCVGCCALALVGTWKRPEVQHIVRQLHNTHWGLVCPAETPEGQALQTERTQLTCNDIHERFC